mmetsp:Transcript_18305/g.33863  ORF Transcript_18305/g.33863 Transcript_18305/m.33863 type:complete len:173 (-) Transcript_18305:686-1204(-)
MINLKCEGGTTATATAVVVVTEETGTEETAIEIDGTGPLAVADETLAGPRLGLFSIRKRQRKRLHRKPRRKWEVRLRIPSLWRSEYNRWHVFLSVLRASKVRLGRGGKESKLQCLVLFYFVLFRLAAQQTFKPPGKQALWHTCTHTMLHVLHHLKVGVVLAFPLFLPEWFGV